MNKRSLKTLAKDYGVEDFRECIYDACINGYPKLVVERFHLMRVSDRKDFLTQLVEDMDTIDNSIQKKVLLILIQHIRL